MSSAPVQALAFYLPQYHPIAENDAWWGPGFTEWRNVAPAQPQFAGHAQPRQPADLGYYDLRVPEVRAAQAALARAAGLHAFCYYHYWFNGRRLLEQPFEAVLASGQPDFPFCLCWANENWTRTWDGHSGVNLIEQVYSADDDRAHLRALAPAFGDPRYVRVDSRPLFLVYRASRLPDPRQTTDRWRAEARALGLGELFLCRVESFPEDRADPRPLGFDAAVEFQPDWLQLPPPLRRTPAWQRLRRWGLAEPGYGQHRVYSYPALVAAARRKPPADYVRFPCVMPGWDNSARRKQDAVIFVDSSPDRYEAWLRAVATEVQPLPSGERLLFINAWNEWGEGCYLEPDAAHGHAYLDATRRVLLPGAADRP
jgi:lipopolysaccharide biosynthesis protein